MKEREHNYDLLRVIASFAVVIGHVAALFIETFIWDLHDGLPGNHPLFSVMYTAIPRFSVPVFLMLSGAFVLASKRTEDAASFYRRSLKVIGIPAGAAILFGFLYSLFTGLLIDHTGALPAFQALLAAAPFYHLWYLPVLAGTYLLAPWICRFKNAVDPKTFRYASYGMLVLGCLALWLNPPVEMHWNIGEVFCYTGFFMTGCVLREDARGKRSSGWIFILAALVLHMISGMLVYRALLSGMDRAAAEHRYFMSYAPLTAAASVLMFAGFARLRVKTDTGFIASHAYNIYLIHAFLLDIAVRIIRPLTGQRWLTHLDARFAVPLLAVLLFLASIGCSIVLRKMARRKQTT